MTLNWNQATIVISAPLQISAATSSSRSDLVVAAIKLVSSWSLPDQLAISSSPPDPRRHISAATWPLHSPRPCRSVKFFTIVHQVTPCVSFFSEYLELFSDFRHISVSLSDSIPLAVSDVRPPRKCIYLFVLSLGVLPNEFLVLHLPKIHDKIHK